MHLELFNLIKLISKYEMKIYNKKFNCKRLSLDMFQILWINWKSKSQTAIKIFVNRIVLHNIREAIALTYSNDCWSILDIVCLVRS